ncbi:Cof-type HAD-IIB family hydrolase [Streptococcus constellatus subsp. viborgensis]|uniref:Cof-type HAD-IIB family hydrolase n=1 Tax=Streptococcus constellatus TaxID=76860 RepID=UPI0018E14729|nr:Cof-type HAD-IIB family hydrolase [Streptococcus constellatus]QQC22500.1 Cof-type HAD-IIB family hydrolase [Streptococcus constellatus]
MARKILCVTDLDGTFVKDSVDVSPEDLQAYQRLMQYSDFAIATGRSVKEINYLAQRNHLQLKYAIGFNGAMVVEKENVLFSRPLAQSDVRSLLDYLQKEQLIFDALDGEERIGNFDHEDKRRLWNVPILCLDNPYDLVCERQIYKFNIRPEASKTASYVQTLKEQFPHLEVYQSGGTRIEVTAKNVSKGSSLQLLKNHDQLVVTFGDSGNDISMFEKSDISYCMAHAPSNVQDTATYVVDHFADAVKHLEKLLYQNSIKA